MIFPTHTQITMNSCESDYRITETQWFDPLGFSLHTRNNHTKVSLGNNFFDMSIRSSISSDDFFTLPTNLLMSFFTLFTKSVKKPSPIFWTPMDVTTFDMVLVDWSKSSSNFFVFLFTLGGLTGIIFSEIFHKIKKNFPKKSFNSKKKIFKKFKMMLFTHQHLHLIFAYPFRFIMAQRRVIIEHDWTFMMSRLVSPIQTFGHQDLSVYN